MADLPVSDRAQLLAEGLDIPPSSYAGRDKDAIVAMILVAGYRFLSFEDKKDVLYIISDHMGFGTSNPAFLAGCRNAIVMMVANPVWVPASLTNSELETEITFWKNASSVLKDLGFTSLIPLGVSKGKAILSDKMLGKSSISKSVGKFAKSPFIGFLLFGSAAQSIASQAINTLEQESDRRGNDGRMTPLTTQRYGSKS
jgi:hypothetical protein